MAFTDQCDMFAAFHEDGFNRIIEHVRLQRPSLFNYATLEVARNPELACKAIKKHPIVDARNNPSFTIVDPLTIPGSNVAVNFAVQLSELAIDFHPGKNIELPPELSPPLAPQRFGIKLTVCGGMGCPNDQNLDKFIPPPKDTDDKRDKLTFAANSRKDEGGREVVVLPTRKLHCFCLSAFVTGGVRIATYNGKPYLEPFLDGFEIVDIKPEGLENSLECLISLMLRLVVLPGLRILLQTAPFNLTKGATDFIPVATNITISPQPVSPALPNNPAIEDDQLKAFIKVEVA